MEQRLEKLSENVNDIKSLIQTFNKTLENIENRLSRLEKMDSIEHRVEVNQIDLSDIKEALQNIEDVQVKVLKELETRQGNDDEIHYLTRRLDSHLVKIAKAEEEIIMLKTK